MHKVLVILRKEFLEIVQQRILLFSILLPPLLFVVIPSHFPATRRQWVESQFAGSPVPARVDPPRVHAGSGRNGVLEHLSPAVDDRAQYDCGL